MPAASRLRLRVALQSATGNALARADADSEPKGKEKRADALSNPHEHAFADPRAERIERFGKAQRVAHC
ncbi:MAG: hypothetical protein NVS9B12_02310 [Vulcanimicrobiaceae bacterium]